ncbi:MAG: Gfo/Idh/MocA family oxidoreductase [Burkholderiales bacterium]
MLNVAVVGLGWWGRIIIGLLEKSTRLRVVRAVEPEASAAAFARERGIACSDNLDSALADPGVKGVVLCTPHSQHAGQVVSAAQAGRHVFCEKPLALRRADALRALAAVEAAGVTLGVGHERRFEPGIVELRRLIAAGEIGRPLQVEANFSQDKFLAMPAENWRLTAAEAPAGPLTATGVHLVDLSVAIMGQPERAFASVKQLGSHLVNGDTLGAMLGFRDGGNALLSAILATPFDGRFAVYGSKGWIEVRDKAHPESPEGWVFTLCRRGAARVQRDIAPASPVLDNLEAFAEAALGGRPYPMPREEMLATVSALEAIVRSAASGRVEPVQG